MNLVKTGWQGIVAEVPEDWSLTAVSGEDKEGYFRIDSPKSQILEVKWSKVKGKTNLQATLTKYIDDLKKRARKRKLDFEYKIKAKDESLLNFSWKSDRRASGRIWKCDNCERVIIAQLSGALNEDVSLDASRILPSIIDHGEDGWQIWGVYGLVTEIPPGYVLDKYRLMSGYIMLEFKKKNDRITIERWGLAGAVLKKESLREWYMHRAVNELKHYRLDVEDVLFEDEDGLQITGRRASLREHFRTVFELMSFRKPSYKVNGYVWHCRETNKIFSIQTVHSVKENVIDGVLERTVCH